MRLPIGENNPAEFLAAVAIMRMTGARSRFTSAGLELDRAITADDLMPHLVRRATVMADWPDDVSPEFLDALHRRAIDSPYIAESAAMLGSIGRKEGPDKLEWIPSWWRLVSGRQKWIADTRRAMESIDLAALSWWLRQPAWPRTERMGMTGVDAAAYTPAALRWEGSDTAAGSRGHPVSLWLMWEGYHALPSYHGITMGWTFTGIDDYPTPVEKKARRFRWGAWRNFVSSAIVLAIYAEQGICAPSLDVPYDPSWADQDAGTTIRDRLRRIGIDAIYEARLRNSPAGSRYWRLSDIRVMDYARPLAIRAQSV